MLLLRFPTFGKTNAFVTLSCPTFVASDQFYRVQLPGQSGLGPVLVLGLAPPSLSCLLGHNQTFLKEIPVLSQLKWMERTLSQAEWALKQRQPEKALDFLLKQTCLSFSTTVVPITLAYALELPGREIPEHA